MEDEEKLNDIRTKSKDKFNYIPDVKCENDVADNGVFAVQITNLQTLAENGLFASLASVALQFLYRRVATSIGHHPDIDNIWRIRGIKVGNISEDGKLFIKLPVYLHDYNIQFSIKAFDIKSNEWMGLSAFNTINIPSFLVNNTYKIGDIVGFRNENEFCVSEAKIIQNIDEETFKIGYFLYDPNNGDEDDDNAWIQIEQKIHVSRLYRSDNWEMQYEIEIIDSTQMEQQLLIKRNDSVSIEVYKAIDQALTSYSDNYCCETYGLKLALIYWEPMTTFVTKNIFDFLYESQFEYKVNCLMSPHSDGKLVMKNLRESHIRTSYDALKNGNLPKGSYSFEDISYFCDWCRCEFKGYHYLFQCSAKFTDRHDVCLNCVYTVIRLGTELTMYLTSLLQNKLNNDCIEVIVDYVIGKAVCIKTNAEQQSIVINSDIPWRKPVVHSKNQLFVNILENIHVIIDESNELTKKSLYVTGKIIINSQLSGMPICRIAVNTKHRMEAKGKSKDKILKDSVELEDVTYHQSVKLNEFEEITFVPPDGLFTLMTYKVTKINISLPLDISFNILTKKDDNNSIQYNLEIKSKFKKGEITKMVIVVAVPPNTTKMNIIEQTIDNAHCEHFEKFVLNETKMYENEEGVIFYYIPQINPGQSATFKCDVIMSAPINMESWNKPLISVQFELSHPYRVFSGIRCVLAKVRESKMNYSAGTWVQYVTTGTVDTFKIRI